MHWQRDNYLPSWFLQMYISFSAEVIFVALHRFAYGSILLPVTNKGKYIQILILILKNGPRGPVTYCDHYTSRRKSQKFQCIYSIQSNSNTWLSWGFHSAATEDYNMSTVTNSTYWMFWRTVVSLSSGPSSPLPGLRDPKEGSTTIRWKVNKYLPVNMV